MVGLGLGLGLNRQVSAFSPLQATNLRAWWDSADTSTITESGGKVSQWDDKSGNGYHYLQATGSAQPTTGSTTQNGKNVIDFTGAQDMAVGSAIGGSNVDVWTVFKTADTTGGIIHSATTAAAGFSLTARNGDTNTALYSNFGTPTLQKNGTTVTPANRDAAYDLFYIDNWLIKAELGANISSWADWILNGYASDFGNVMSIADQIVMDAETSGFRLNMLNYLKSKWAIT